MEGVTILNTIMEYEGIIPAGVLGSLLILGVCCATVSIVIIAFFDEDKATACLVAFIVCVMLCLVGLIVNIFAKTDEVSSIQYQVTIDETVNFKEFTDKYEIIRQDGDIYTIEEKGSSND